MNILYYEWKVYDHDSCTRGKGGDPSTSVPLLQQLHYSCRWITPTFNQHHRRVEDNLSRRIGLNKSGRKLLDRTLHVCDHIESTAACRI